MGKFLGKFCAILVGMIALTGCSSSDDVASISAPSGVATTQTIDVLNAFYRLPIQSQGKWTASVLGDDSDWIYLVQKEGTGNGEVLLSVDCNFSDAQRSAVVRITDETGYVDYTIAQPNAETNGDTNGEADVQYSNSGLGMGLYIDSQGGESTVYSMMSQQIFNFQEMGDSLVSKLGNFVTSRDMSRENVTTKDFTQGESSGTDITADLSVNIKYGLFNLDLTGNFHMYGSSKDSTSTWAASVSRPMTYNQLGYSQISGKYPWKKEMDEEYKTIRACLFSAEFLNLQDQIEELIIEGKTTDDEELKGLLDELNDEFGPAFINSVTLGGVVDIDFQRSESQSSDSLDISGTLGVGFNSLFSINVQASAEYLRQAKSLTTGGTLNINISGGSIQAQNKLIGEIGKICSDGYDVTKIINAITDWNSTITVANSEISDVTVNGIWNLFSSSAKSKVKAYIKSKYPTKDADGKEIQYMYNIQKMR